MRNFKSLTATTALVLALTTQANAQEHQMTLAHVLSDQSPYQVILEEFKTLIEDRSEGRIAVEVQCCGQAGNETRAIQSFRTGILTGGMVGGSSLETVVPAYRVLSLPYLFDSKQQAYDVLQSDIGTEMLSKLEEFDMMGLGFGSIYERSIASTVPITSVDDMAGLKIRVLPTPGFVEAYNSLGTQPTPMAYGEVFMAMQNQVVDALEISPDAYVADRFHEATTDFTLTNTHQSTTIFVLSRSFWEGLPEDLQTMVQDAAAEAIAAGILVHDELADAGLETARAAGVTIHEPDLAPFMEKARMSWPVILDGHDDAAGFLTQIEASLGR
ncbi:TRAP transporter substrate-binding protein [Roseicitreum antarcticum]|uniref:Tripartite ATP-independent transporter solute receptor, DctP family n=1 Tax=Roseicitreum antarcticum TaxID=564137 RepID=A0A1H2Z049_9RHOB|nr:TRAP transporter substrate-binding protein [Roseicitreum antarcticum]SDX10721.1 tripartite ATP-independent transporter solute receptor, DctP family [Roseicitreum antarcticum]